MSDFTIRMPKKLLTKWLELLRSGKIKQGRSRLVSEEGYCCLGVLYLAAGEEPLPYWSYPDPEWLERNKVEFKGRRGDKNYVSENPYMPLLEEYAASANDNGVSFAEIADAIEDCAEGT